MTLAGVYGFWKYVSNLDRRETRRYLEMFYALKYRKLVSISSFTPFPNRLLKWMTLIENVLIYSVPGCVSPPGRRVEWMVEVLFWFDVLFGSDLGWINAILWDCAKKMPSSLSSSSSYAFLSAGLLMLALGCLVKLVSLV